MRKKTGRRGNPYAGLIQLLNRRYHAEFVRAELLQNELDAIRRSRLGRGAEWLRQRLRRVFPHPAADVPRITEQSQAYRGYPRPVPDARVSIIIPFRDQPELLRNCVRSLRGSTFGNVEIVLVDNDSADPRTHRLLARLVVRRDFRRTTCRGSFNFSRLCNAGAAVASGDHLLFLNNDTEVLSRDWLERMLVLAADSAVGVVGATLLYPDRTIQHAGLFPRSDGQCVHPHRGHLANSHAQLREVRTVPAVTAACLMIRRAVFDEVGGFDERFPVTMNDVDLCRRVRAGGRLVVISPAARLIHYEGLSRGFAVDVPGA